MITKKKTTKKPTDRITKERLAEMIEEATVDAYEESEQAMGWFTMLENYLELSFETDVLGVRVTVAAVDLRDDNRIVAVCTRGKGKLAVGIADLPMSSPRPEGAEWIEAYRAWLRGRG